MAEPAVSPETLRHLEVKVFRMQVDVVADATGLFRLTRVHADAAAQTLAQAFASDPLYAYVIRNPDARARLLPELFSFRIRYGVRYGAVHATSPQMEGIAMWLPSNRVHMTQWRMLRAGGLRFYLQAGESVVARLNSIHGYVLSLLARLDIGPHWHMGPMAVAPDLQGKGHGASLLRPVLAQLDRQGHACLVETNDEENVRLYEHFGFRVAERGAIPGANLPLWVMVRGQQDPEPRDE